jgi:hypothetical protein
MSSKGEASVSPYIVGGEDGKSLAFLSPPRLPPCYLGKYMYYSLRVFCTCARWV